MAHEPAAPIGARNPAILHSSGNLMKNAVDYAQGRVEVIADWSNKDRGVTIRDYAPGFASVIMDRIGGPYVRSSKRAMVKATSIQSNLEPLRYLIRLLTRSTIPFGVA